MEDHFSLIRVVRNVLHELGIDQTPYLPEWDRIRTLLMKALSPFEDARRAVHAALIEAGRMPRESLS